MDQSFQPLIVFSEWLPTGIVVHFDQGVSAFFSAHSLFQERDSHRLPNLQDEDHDEDD